MSCLSDLVHGAFMSAFCGREAVLIEGGTYRVVERIGSGGFANIELVQHATTKQKFALKRIDCHSTEDQIAAQREVEYHKLFDHSGILSCEGSAVVGTADIMHNQTSQVQILLPYYPRGTLQQELERRSVAANPFPESLVCSLFLQILRAVHHMHTAEPNPMAHRDINPRNVLLSAEDMRPVLMDLGSTCIARVSVASHAQAQRLQDDASQNSSMTYRAPELFQVDSRCEVDERTDVWSLGCLLYALCFYQSPYDPVADRGDSVALAVQSERLQIPTGSLYSTDLHNAITWMLTPDPTMRPHVAQLLNRFADMAALADSGDGLQQKATNGSVANV